MATRSLIGYQDKTTKQITSIYCHWDGYPKGVGVTLLEHYNTKKKLKELFKKGDMSSLGDTVGECKYYVDTGESAQDLVPGVSASLSEYIQRGNDYGTNYLYLYVNRTWYVVDKRIGLCSLKQVLKQKEEE